VSVEEWDAVQERLKQNRRFSVGRAKHFFLLRKLMKCEYCGKSFYGYTHCGNRRYECAGTLRYSHKYQCRAPHWYDASKLERFIWNEVVAKLDEVVSENNAIDNLLDVFEKDRTEIQGKLGQEREALRNMSNQEQRVLARESKGDITEKQADLQFRVIREEKEHHEAEIAKYETMLANDGSVQVQQLIERAQWLHTQYSFGNFDAIPNDVKRHILEEVVDTITVSQDDAEVILKLPNPKITETVLYNLCYLNK
jgi:hypothetical protein